jgi:hypothetical protein
MPDPLDLGAIRRKRELLERLGAPSAANVWQNAEVQNMIAVIEALREALFTAAAWMDQVTSPTNAGDLQAAIEKINAALALVRGGPDAH